MAVNKVINLIKNQSEHQKLAHAFLLETNDVARCNSDVLEAIKFLNCPNLYERECNVKCNICRLIDERILPSIITINPDGSSIKKEQVNDLKKRLSCKPVYTKYNNYIINYAEKLNASSANTMLKFLEEPEEFIIGFLITENKENIISTIKSRCQIYNVLYEENEIYKDDIEFINDYFESVHKSNGFLDINKNKLLVKYTDKESVLSFFKNLFLIIKDDLIANINSEKNYNIKFLQNEDDEYIFQLLKLVEKTLQKLKYNVNLELLLDSFYIELRRLNE